MCVHMCVPELPKENKINKQKGRNCVSNFVKLSYQNTKGKQET